MAELTGQSRRSSWLTPMVAVQAVVLAGLLVYHYRPVLDRLVQKWYGDPDWSHGFIIPLFSLYYLYLQRDRMPTGLAGGRVMGRLAGAMLLMIGFYLYYKGVIWRIGYPKDLSLVFSIGGVVLMTCGWPLARWSWFAVAFLIFALPVPVSLYEQLTMPLRQIAATVSGFALSLWPGLTTDSVGTLVEWEYFTGAGMQSGTLDVERACSGMRLMVTMTALGVAMAFVNDRALWHRFVMIIACVPIAIFCNIIRVTVTGFMTVLGQKDLASGVPHTLLGLAMLVIAFGLYSSIAYVLGHLFVEAGPDEGKVGSTAVGATS